MTDQDGDPLWLTVRYAVDNQDLWSVPLLVSPEAQFGSPLLDVTNAVLREIATHDGAQLATNLLAVQWDTRATLPSLPPLVPDMRLRLSVSNAWFAAPAMAITPPFMVDNESPSQPTALQSSSHTFATWSRETDFDATWNGSSDGAGIAGIRYFARLSPDTDDNLDSARSFAATSARLDVSDGSNQWLAVQARDAFGNRSGIARVGPYFIDSTPPDSIGATVHVARSLFGDYVVGDRLATRWGGFSDPLSGIAGYQVLVQTPTALVPYLMTAQTQANVKVSMLNVTNAVWVYAFDQVGNSSLIIGDSVLILAPNGDWDGDGYSNTNEELAGTDSDDAQSLLRLFTTRTAPPAGTFAIAWMGLQGRTYTLWHAESLIPAPIWCPVPGQTAVAGTGEWMFHTPDQAKPVGFFKLSVQ